MGKKILIVDDSALMRRVACDIIKQDGRYDKPDLGHNGEEALQLTKKNKYDAIVLDVNMPIMDGIEFLRQLKKEGLRERVMMFSTTTGEGTKQTIDALELGALDFIKKPDDFRDASGADFTREFLDKLAVVSGAGDSMAPARPRQEAPKADMPMPSKTGPISLRPAVQVSGEKIIAIASSTGGPKALQFVIPLIPAEIDAPVILVQHMPAGFTKSLAERLDTLSKLSVKEAEDGDILQKGHLYIAPGGVHMKVAKSGPHTKIFFSMEPPREGVRPAANYMYESLKDTSYAQVCCVVLTGMGADGTAGIKDLDTAKKIHVIAQDEKSCAVYGMPKAIALTGLVNEVVPLTKIADAIVKQVGTR